MVDHPRIEELQRRVQKDPASIAFAQLAEEYRRAGSYEEAVRVCRTGLAKHPSYLSARVTLGRALIELEQYGEAQTELDYVLKSAPENLAAIRGLAEIHQRRGELDDALRQYRTALGIAKHDPDIEQSVQDISRELGHAVVDVPAAAPSRPATAEPSSPDEATAAAATWPIAEPTDDIADLEAGLLSLSPPDAPAKPALNLGPELEAAADDFAKALEALDSLTIELPTPQPLPEETLDLPIVPTEDDHRVVPAADWEIEGFNAALARRSSQSEGGWAKRDEPAEPPPSAPPPETLAHRSSKSEGGTFDPVITFTDQTIAPVAAVAPARVHEAAPPLTEPKDEVVAALESFLEAILEDQQEHAGR